LDRGKKKTPFSIVRTEGWGGPEGRGGKSFGPGRRANRNAHRPYKKGEEESFHSNLKNKESPKERGKG